MAKQSQLDRILAKLHAERDLLDRAIQMLNDEKQAAVRPKARKPKPAKEAPADAARIQ